MIARDKRQETRDKKQDAKIVPHVTCRLSRKGFTLIETMIYLAIVSVILTSISYLILDIIGSQVKNVANEEVNHNIRFIQEIISRDISSAQDISSLSGDTLVLSTPGDDITYNFNDASATLTRQVGAGLAELVNTDSVNISGSFEDNSFLTRSKNINFGLRVVYKNPNNLPDYNASTTATSTIELRGRR